MKGVHRLCQFVFPGKANVNIAVFSAGMIESRLLGNKTNKGFANAAREK